MKTTERGLGWDHQRQRQRLLAQLTDGTPCDHCGEPMDRTQDLDADHEQARARGGSQASRLLHSKCNRSRGDGTSRQLVTSRAWNPWESAEKSSKKG